METNQPEPLSCAAIRELDRRAIEEWGMPSFALMESAGRACADAVAELLPTGGGSSGPVQVLAGPGNNGGDGFVVARTLRNRGVAAEVAFVGTEEQLARGSADVRLNTRLWRTMGGALTVLESAADVGNYTPRLDRAAVAVDALFGTGLTRPLASPWSDAVLALNASGAPVVAVDLPSGLDGDTGDVLGACVRARVTVTFIAPKIGFGRGAGPEHVGQLVVAEIGVPLGP